MARLLEHRCPLTHVEHRRLLLGVLVRHVSRARPDFSSSPARGCRWGKNERQDTAEGGVVKGEVFSIIMVKWISACNVASRVARETQQSYLKNLIS